MNLTFKRYLESRVVLQIENDYIEQIEGRGLDAELMRSYVPPALFDAQCRQLAGVTAQTTASTTMQTLDL